MARILYIDVLFLVNWMMDVVLLWLAGRLWRRRICPWRVGVAAILGAVWVCLITALGWNQGWLRLLSLWVTAGGMIRLAYPGGKIREWLRGMLCLYLVTLVLGGWIHGIYEHWEWVRILRVWMANGQTQAVTVWLLAVAMVTGMGAMTLGLWYGKASINRQRIQEVTLRYKEREITVMALWDSGNQLQDPFTGKEVHILQRELLEKLLGKTIGQSWKITEETEFPMHLIPCRSLGEAHTLLPVFTIEKMILSDGSVIENPAIGISPHALFEDQKAQMLLHAQTDELRRKPMYGH